MKKSNEYSDKDVKAYAIKVMTSTSAILFGKMKKLDRRFNFNRDVIKFIEKNPVNKFDILKKRRDRAKNKPSEFINVLSRPLVKDFKNNKAYLRQILPDRLCFHSGRNHWAKDSFDFKILAILRKGRY